MLNYDPDVGTARADVFRFLSACYYEPTPVFAEERMFEALERAVRRLEPALAEDARGLGEAFAAGDPQELLVDYTRLFMGPVQPLAPPYGSHWLGTEPTLMQDSTLAVLALYGQSGFELDENFHELPDHVAVELEFLYLLNFKQALAQRQSDPTAAGAIESLKRRFLGEHLGVWYGPFTAAVSSGARTDFYRRVAGMTERCLRLQTIKEVLS